jgi:hypothetical protein
MHSPESSAPKPPSIFWLEEEETIIQIKITKKKKRETGIVYQDRNIIRETMAKRV